MDIVWGDVNPTGRLPITFPIGENDLGFTFPGEYPGSNGSCTGKDSPRCEKPGQVNYTTHGLFTGYRWYDQHAFAPAFPFGHGLSFTSFSYDNLQASSDNGTVTVDITNNGTVAGAEVAQLYLGFPAEAAEPPKQLKGFVKTAVLAAGATQGVAFNLRDRDLSIWDVSAHDWAKQKGEFKVFVGASSRDIRAVGALTV